MAARDTWTIEQLELEWSRRATARKLAGEDLTQAMRNKAAVCVLGLRGGWPALEEALRQFGTSKPPSASTLRRPTLKRRHQDLIVRLVNERLRPSAALSCDDFFAKKIASATPVAAFVAWLRDARVPRNEFLDFLPAPSVDLAGDAGAVRGAPGRMDGIMDFLRKSDLRTVKVVHQPGMSDGLRALAAHIVYSALPADDELKWRDVCYLPVDRDPITHERVTFPRLVGWLDAFYRPPPDGHAAREPDDAEALRAALSRIRAAMMKRPTILIFDGHKSFRGAVRETRALVSDDALTALLRETLHPLMDPDGAPDASIFYSTRYLVLADHPLGDFEAVSDRSLALAFLPADRVEPVLRSQGRQSVDLLVGLYHDDMRSDSAMALAETVIALRRARLGASASNESLSSGLTSPDRAFDALVSELCEQVNFAALFALRAVSITDGGLREATLTRLAGQWNKLARADERPFALPDLTIADVRASLDCLNPILWRGRDERVPGLDDLTEPFVYLDDERTDETLSENDRRRSFDLRSSEVRESAIKAFLSAPGGAESLTLMHRLLAEEALRQQTHAMRHAEWRGSADARYYRRLVQTLFHGYCSLALGPGRSGPMNDAAPTVLPPNASSAYRRLYAVFFRRLLEHPPHYDLSRSLGLDRVKIELTRRHERRHRAKPPMAEHLCRRRARAA